MASTINFNLAAFQALFPEYASYAPSAIQQYWNNATAYISNRNGGCYFGSTTLQQQTTALNLMTAHLVFLAGIISNGGQKSTGDIPGVVVASSIDKISVTLEPPPIKDMWQYWLSTSPYGQQLLALLQLAGAGGFYISTAPAGRAGFRYGGV